MTLPPPREAVVTRLRPHARALFWPTLLLIAVAGATGFFGGSLPEEWQNIAVLVAAAVLLVAGWLVPLLRWLARSYTITTRRTVVRSGVLVRERQELLHSRARDVTVRKRALQSMFGSGDVLLDSGSEFPVVLADVPSANLVQEALHDLIESRPDTSIG